MNDLQFDPRGMMSLMLASAALAFWNNDVLFFGLCGMAALTALRSRDL